MIPEPFLWDYFIRRIKDDGSCWIWSGSIGLNGYGRIRSRTRNLYISAHRLSYRWFRGPFRANEEIDHLCRRRSCVNPDHLEQVSHSVNMARGVPHTRLKMTCPKKHPYDSVDVLGRRFCRKCAREAKRRYKEKCRNG